MSNTKTNTRSELPGNDVLPVFTWEERLSFAALVLSLGGSSDTHGADLCVSDRSGHHGRYPRNYTSSDSEGQTMSFLSSTMRCSATAPRGVVGLIGAPWATQAEREATYAWLSLAGVSCNDMTADEKHMALTMRASAVVSS